MIVIGCCGFPISRKKYYELFDSVEIQQTFYRFPRIETVKKWKEESPNGFKFSIKAFQGITHDIRSPTWKKSGIKDYKSLKGKVGFLRPTKEVFGFWEKTVEIARILEARFIIIQLPASFKDTEENIKNAYEFFSSVSYDRIGIELRGWSEENIRKLCEEFDLIDVTDPFKREPVYIKDIVYFRLHGKHNRNKIVYSYDYSERELKWLADYIKKLDIKEGWVMFNNLYMLKNAQEFKKFLL